jgi:glycine/D-amino acid oxidase-like deaminating enzyme
MDRDERCGVAIVGAGFTGALLADALSDAGVDVVVVDARAAGRGSTMASTAIIQYELDLSLLALGRRVGEDVARGMYRASARAVSELVSIAAALPGCALEPRDSLYLGTRRADAARLRLECKARAAIGLDVEFLSPAAVRRAYGLRAHGAILSRTAAAGDPWALTHTLLDDSVRRGARVYDGTRIMGISTDADAVRLATERGPVLRAERVVLAAGYETEATLRAWGLPLRRRLAKLKSTYAIATTPLPRAPEWLERTVVWETARPYLYLRGAPGGRAMTGGLDEAFRDPDRRDRLIPGKAARLRRRLERTIPSTGAAIENAWAGTFGESGDSAGYIDAHPRFPRLMLVAGYGGNGMTLSVLAREVVREWCRGTEHPEAALWRLVRRNAAAPGDLMNSRSKWVNAGAPAGPAPAAT